MLDAEPLEQTASGARLGQSEIKDCARHEERRQRVEPRAANGAAQQIEENAGEQGNANQARALRSLPRAVPRR